MADRMPYDEDMMTLIMGVSPEKPGQHGRVQVPDPGEDAIGVVTQIRDLCEDFLRRAGKEDGEDETPEEGEKEDDDELQGRR